MGFKRPLVQIQSLGPEKVLKLQGFRAFSLFSHLNCHARLATFFHVFGQSLFGAGPVRLEKRGQLGTTWVPRIVGDALVGKKSVEESGAPDQEPRFVMSI